MTFVLAGCPRAVADERLGTGAGGERLTMLGLHGVF